MVERRVGELVGLDRYDRGTYKKLISYWHRLVDPCLESSTPKMTTMTAPNNPPKYCKTTVFRKKYKLGGPAYKIMGPLNVNWFPFKRPNYTQKCPKAMILILFLMPLCVRSPVFYEDLCRQGGSLHLWPHRFWAPFLASLALLCLRSLLLYFFASYCCVLPRFYPALPCRLG